MSQRPLRYEDYVTAFAEEAALWLSGGRGGPKRHGSNDNQPRTHHG